MLYKRYLKVEVGERCMRKGFRGFWETKTYIFGWKNVILLHDAVKKSIIYYDSVISFVRY